MQDKILSMVGMATKAGKTQSGEFLAEAAVKERKAKLVIVATDASDNTKKLFHDKCSFYHVPIFEYATKDELGKRAGKASRATIAIIDSGFAGRIKELFCEQTSN